MCKYNIDEICVNADCPYRADYCPCYENDSICKYMADSFEQSLKPRSNQEIKNILNQASKLFK